MRLSLSVAFVTIGFAAAATAAPKAVVHHVEKLADNVYVITARGGNIGLFVTDNHALLVDCQMEPLVPGLLKAVKSVTNNPVKYLVNTHYHNDHVGGNRAMTQTGTTAIAHVNVYRRMKEEQAKLDASKRGGLPEIVTGDKDPTTKARMNIYLDSSEIHLMHPASAAHTDGDVFVGSPAAKVLHLGDLVFLGMLPFIDVQAGGSVAGLLAAVEGVLAWLPDDAKVIPGHGPVCDKKTLRRYADFLGAALAHAKANAGKTAKALAESFDSKAWEGEWKPNPQFVTWETFFEAVTGTGTGRVAE